MLPVKQFFSALLDVFLPPICHICHSFIPNSGKLHICPVCLAGLKPVLSPFCPVCGIPFPGAGGDHLCGACLGSLPAFDRAVAAFHYEGAIRELIHAFKYNQKSRLRYPLALLTLDGLGDLVKGHEPHLIIPVPLHRSKLRQRGYNQAVLLGQVLSRQLALPMLTDALIRTRRTEPQIELSGAERRLNVKGAFTVKKTALIEERRILLLDDVMTTGSTLDECAKELKKAGASSVIAVTIARTAR